MSIWRLAAVALLVGCATSTPEKPVAKIDVTSDWFALEESERSAWIGYGLAKRVWHDVEFAKQFPGQPYRNTIEEELFAREGLVDIWRHMRSENSWRNAYLDSLEKVVSAGYLREYVWFCLPHDGWDEPGEIQRAEFERWHSANLAPHDGISLARAFPRGGEWVVQVGTPAHPPMPCFSAAN